MARSIALPLLLLVVIFSLTSCDPDDNADNYLEYNGVRYPVAAAVDQISLGRTYGTWEVQIGTVDMYYDDTDDSWYGTGLLLDAILFTGITGDLYDYLYEFGAGTVPGNLFEIRIMPDSVDGAGTWVDNRAEGTVEVSMTGELFTVDVSVLMDDGTDGGALLTGHFVGAITEVTFSVPE